MKVTRKDIETVASLSRLNINEDEVQDVTEQLDKFLNYVENLKSVDTTDIEPTTYALKNVFRDDVVKPSLSRELALSNAPLKEDGYFKVPRVLEN